MPLNVCRISSIITMNSSTAPQYVVATTDTYSHTHRCVRLAVTTPACSQSSSLWVKPNFSYWRISEYYEFARDTLTIDSTHTERNHTRANYGTFASTFETRILDNSIRGTARRVSGGTSLVPPGVRLGRHHIPSSARGSRHLHLRHSTPYVTIPFSPQRHRSPN